jgi:hypothetical protein
MITASIPKQVFLVPCSSHSCLALLCVAYELTSNRTECYDERDLLFLSGSAEEYQL